MRIRKVLFGVATASTFFVTAGIRADVVAHYKFDELSGTNAAPSVGAVNGTLQGSASFSPAAGISGGAVDLSATGEGVVSMGNNFAFLTGSFTISFWAKTTTTADDSIFLSKHSAGITSGYLFPVNETGGGGTDNKATFVVSTNVINGVTSTTDVNDGTWRQIVGVYNALGTHSVYVDGAPAEQTKADAPMIAAAANFYVGGVGLSGNPSIADGRYTGLIDDLQIYNTALSDSDIDFLFANPGSVLPEPATAGLIGVVGLVAMRRRRR